MPLTDAQETAVQEEQAARWAHVLDEATKSERRYIQYADRLVESELMRGEGDYADGVCVGWNIALGTMRKFITDEIEARGVSVTRYASVTSIIGGGVPKPAIPRWAGKMVAEAAAPFILEPERPFPIDGGEAESRADLQPEQVIYWLKEAPWRDRDAAADLGSLVHRYVEAHNLGKPQPAWPMAVKPFMENFDRFVTEHGVGFEAAEMKVYSRQFGYAGTLDAICTIAGRRGLLDIKTGRSGVYPETALQLAAYAHCDFCIADPNHPGARQITPGRGRRWYEWHGEPADEMALPEIECAWALHLRPDAYALIPVRIDDEVFEAFLCAMAVDDYVQRVGRGVLGKPVDPVGQTQLEVVT